MTILIAEDNPRTRQLLKRTIENSNMKVKQFIEVEKEEDAVMAFRNNRPNWVLMDIGLKDGDGLQAAAKILQTDANARVIVITMFDDPAYREVAARIGVFDFVLKENLEDVIHIMTS